MNDQQAEFVKPFSYASFVMCLKNSRLIHT